MLRVAGLQDFRLCGNPGGDTVCGSKCMLTLAVSWLDAGVCATGLQESRLGGNPGGNTACGS